MNGKIFRGGRTAARLDAAAFDEVATAHGALARPKPLVPPVFSGFLRFSCHSEIQDTLRVDCS